MHLKISKEDFSFPYENLIIFLKLACGGTRDESMSRSFTSLQLRGKWIPCRVYQIFNYQVAYEDVNITLMIFRKHRIMILGTVS